MNRTRAIFLAVLVALGAGFAAARDGEDAKGDGSDHERQKLPERWDGGNGFPWPDVPDLEEMTENAKGTKARRPMSLPGLGGYKRSPALSERDMSAAIPGAFGEFPEDFDTSWLDKK